MKNENIIKEIYCEFLNLHLRLTIFEKGMMPLKVAKEKFDDFMRNSLPLILEGKDCTTDYEDVFADEQCVVDLTKSIIDIYLNIFGAKYMEIGQRSSFSLPYFFNGNDKPKKIQVLKPQTNATMNEFLIQRSLFDVNYDFVEPYDQFGDIDYDVLNKMLEREENAGAIIVQEYLLKQPKFSKMNNNGKLIIYDATKSLWKVEKGIQENPLKIHEKAILFGRAKEMSACGYAEEFMLINNCELIEKSLKKGIKNILMPHGIASLLLNAFLLSVDEKRTYGLWEGN